MNVAIATCKEFAELANDEAPFLAALAAAGANVRAAVWDDPNVDWSSFDACVIRSTWDFHLRVAEFERWCELAAASTRLINSARLVRWNLHKRYLLELERCGIPIVPTRLIPQNVELSPGELRNDPALERFIVKPAISASSHLTKSFDAGDATASAHVREIQRTGDVLVQPFQNDVFAGGERSYVYVDGDVTHAVRRAPFNGGVTTGASQPPIALRSSDVRLVMRVVAALPEPPLYARVDVVLRNDGVDAVTEAELIEPSLFFTAGGEAAARRLAGAVVRRCADFPAH